MSITNKTFSAKITKFINKPSNKKQTKNLQLTSNTMTLLYGGVRLVLVATQVKREFRCCLPMFGYNKWFTVTPSGLCSKESSITLLSKYHVRFGRGRPGMKQKNYQKLNVTETKYCAGKTKKTISGPFSKVH